MPYLLQRLKESLPLLSKKDAALRGDIEETLIHTK